MTDETGFENALRQKTEGRFAAKLSASPRILSSKLGSKTVSDRISYGRVQEMLTEWHANEWLKDESEDRWILPAIFSYGANPFADVSPSVLRRFKQELEDATLTQDAFSKQVAAKALDMRNYPSAIVHVSKAFQFLIEHGHDSLEKVVIDMFVYDIEHEDGTSASCESVCLFVPGDTSKTVRDHIQGMTAGDSPGAKALRAAIRMEFAPDKIKSAGRH